MSDIRRNADRNRAIQAMMTDGERLKTFYSDMSSYLESAIGEGLDNATCKALCAKDGEILKSLRAYYVAHYETNAEPNRGKEDFLKEYLQDVMPEYALQNNEHVGDNEMNSVYFGTDGEDTAYYYFKDSLNVDNLHRIKEQADEYIIAAPVLYMPQESLEEKNITFLKLGRDVDEAELKVNDGIARFAMRAACNKKLPIEATMVNRNCRADIETGISSYFDGMHLNTDFIANLYEIVKPKPEYIKVKVANDAFIKKSNMGSVFRMPANGEYAGFAYFVFNNNIATSRQPVDTQSDTLELCYEISVRKDSGIDVFRNNEDGEELITLSVEEFKKAVDGTTNKDYETHRSDDTKWFTTSIPQEAFRREYDKSMLFVMPNKRDFGGMSYFMKIVHSSIYKGYEFESFESESLKFYKIRPILIKFVRFIAQTY